MSTELIDVVDSNNQLLNKTELKDIAHRDGLWHRVVHIWIYNENQEVLIQLRAARKAIYPNVWDISSAGHVLAGEEPIQAALRELKEELNIEVAPDDLQFWKLLKVRHHFQTLKEYNISYVYFLKFTGEIQQLTKQDYELQAIKFIPVEELITDLTTHYDKYVPHGGNYWFEVMEYIKNKI